jgi:membrane protease YdiL (CAAX protease family)
MLSAKMWKPVAVMRLCLSVFLCISAGSLATASLNYSKAGGKTLGFFALTAGAFCGLAASLVLLWKPWTFETVRRRLWMLLFCFYASLALGGYAQRMVGPPETSVVQMVIAAVSFQAAALLLVHRFVHEHHTDWPGAFGLRRQWPQAVMLGIMLACVFLPIGWGLQAGIAELLTRLPRLHLAPEEQQAVQTLRIAGSWPQRLVLGLVTILLAPAAEEVLFRGILYPAIKQAGFPQLALWGTALMFAAIHVNLVAFLPLALLALALTLLYERTGNLLAPITAHALFNGLNFTVFYLSDKKFAPLIIFGLVLILVAVAAVFGFRKSAVQP